MRWPAALLVLVAPLALATGQAGGPPSFESTLTVVSLPVFVTGADGRAAVGLRAEDFEVLDDGSPVPVVGFRAFDALAGVAETSGRDLPPAARRQFLLLFDMSFSTPHGIVRAREAALDFVTRKLGPADLVAVATYAPTHGMRLLVSFTSDRTQLRRAVESLGVLKVDRRTDPLGLVYDLRELGSALADTPRGDRVGVDEESARAVMTLFEQSERASYVHRVNGLLDGLWRLAQAVDSLEGRKQVILFSNGFDESLLMGNLGREMAEDSEAVIRGRIWEVPSDFRFGDSGLRHAMEERLRAFARADAVIHAVDLGGLRARGDAREAQAEPPRSGQQSLSQMSELSGGRLFKDTNDLGVALDEVLEMSRHYYLLAFEPAAAKGAGTFHRIRVRLRRKGLKVAHRSGYHERLPYRERTPLAREFESAEIIAKGIDRGEVTVRGLAIPYRTPGRAATLPVALEIEPKGLLAERTEGSLALEVYGYAFDAGGQVADTLAQRVVLDLSRVGDRLRGRGIQLHGAFTLPPGRHDLRFLVREAGSGRSGTLWLRVTVPSFEAAAVSLLPPLLMDDAEDWLVLPLGSPTDEEPAPSPFRVADVPFVPRPNPVLRREGTQKICLLAYDGGRRYDPGASFEITPQIVDAQGRRVAPLSSVEVLEVVAEGGFRWFVLGFSAREVPPGEYTLRVRLRDPASGRVSEAFQPVTVS